MKKILSFFILIILSFVCVACGKDPSISYAKQKIQINFDETYTIDSKDIKIEDSDNDYIITILNTDIALIDKLTIYPKSKGETYVRFQIKGEKVYTDVPLVVTHDVYATSATIENSNVVLDINSTTEVFNRVTTNAGCNEVPLVTYNNNVVSYDYITGKLTPVAVGTTTVVVLFNNCNVSFNVTVIDNIYTTKVEVEDHILYVGNEGKFNYEVFPDLANTYRFYTFATDLLDVNAKGEYVAKAEGEAVVIVEYYIAENTPVSKVFDVKIIAELESFEFDIVNTDSTNAKYYLKEKDYKIVINNIENIKEDDVVVSDNFEIKDFVVGDDNISITGNFVSSGEQTVEVNITSNGNMVTREKSVDIYELSDISIIAKWSGYPQETYQDGKYHIRLENSKDYACYLKFQLAIDDSPINDTFKVYDITTTKTEITTTFTPENVGEVTLQFEFLSVIVGEIIIVVE